jgi:hypothetical protein
MLARRNLLAGIGAGSAMRAIRKASANGGQNLRIDYILPQQSPLGAAA